MIETSLHVHPSFVIADVDRRLFGGFLEHMGRAIYDGVVDRESYALRPAVLEALRPLGMTVVRYPGGNFASGYHWRDGVGPREQRPAVHDRAWNAIEPNAFGTDEFVALCRQMQWDPMLTVNLGTGTPEEAGQWVEYCNGAQATREAELRRRNGHAEPHAVKLWCLGNEMDGPWQIGHVPAQRYAERAQQAAKIMRDTDPTIELVAAGSCGVDLPTYMEWDRQVLEYVADFADYISLHRYVGNPTDDTADYLAVGLAIDRQIEQMDAACRYVQARRRSSKRAYLCFDEWNVWFKDRDCHTPQAEYARPLIEELYNLEDALVVAGFLNSFLRHADCVKIANIAQIVNVIAPVLTRRENVLIQSIHHPFRMFSERARGVSLRCGVDGPMYDSPTYGRASVLDGSAVWEREAGRLHVFAVNREPASPMQLTVDGGPLSVQRLESAETVAGDDPKATNTWDRPQAVTAEPFDDVTCRDGGAVVKLPPLSLTAMTFSLS